MSGQDAATAVSSSLDSQQTKCCGPDEGPIAPAGLSSLAEFMPLPEWTYGGNAPTPRDVEDAFRHSGWREDRVRCLAALRASNASASRIRRFRECGSRLYVEYSRKAGKHRLKAQYCGDRFCKPCAAAKGRIIRDRLREWTKGQRVRFITFTRKATRRTLTDALNDLRTPFFKVRQSVLWRTAVKGGAACVEIKRGRGSGDWHVHLHCLVVGGFIDQRKLSDLWHAATGDSYIVDVREVKDREQGIWYVSKYATKGWSQEMLRDAAGLAECVRVLGGRRLFSTFGEWWGKDPEDDAEPFRDWRVVGRFHVVYAAALRGDAWARGVFQSLGIAPGAIAGQPVFVKPDEDG